MQARVFIWRSATVRHLSEAENVSTEATLARHLRAFAEGIDAIMSDYTEDSVLFTQDAVFRGLGAIRFFFDGVLTNAPPELVPAMRLVRQEIAGDVAFIIWNADPFIPLASDTFVIRGGKILAQSFVVLAPPLANS